MGWFFVLRWSAVHSFRLLRLLAWLLRCAACLGPCAFPVFAHAQIVPFVPSASAGADARSAVPLPPIDGLPAADGLSVRQRDALQPPLPGAKLTKDATTKDGLLKDGAALNEPPRSAGRSDAVAKRSIARRRPTAGRRPLRAGRTARPNCRIRAGGRAPLRNRR